MNNEIWIWAEHKHGEILTSTMELLGEARRLAGRLKGKVCAILLGSDILKLSGELVAYGADAVYLYDDPRLVDFSADVYMHVFSSLKSEHSPILILIAATPSGLCLAPRLAARFQCGFAADTVTINVQADNSLRINRGSCQGKVHGVLSFAANFTVVVTMKPGSVGFDRPVRSRKGETVALTLGDCPASRTEVKGFVKADPKVVALAEAECVVAGGCGFHEKEELGLLADLSAVLGGAIGGSKPIVDMGWLPHRRLVGQSSGRRLSPHLFVGVGISGSSHFVEGMKDSRLIIAINLDKAAPLMKLADLAVVGDLHSVLPEVTKQIGQRKKGTV